MDKAPSTLPSQTNAGTKTFGTLERKSGALRKQQSGTLPTVASEPNIYSTDLDGGDDNNGEYNQPRTRRPGIGENDKTPYLTHEYT